MANKNKRKTVSKSIQDSPFFKELRLAVPIDVFRACVIVYDAAARLTMPAPNPEQYKVKIEDKVYAFRDGPMNRGMMAVKDFLREEQAYLFPGISSRIMASGFVLTSMRRDNRFARFFKEDTDDGAYMVSEALIEAFATAEFEPGSLEINIDSLLSVAHKNLDEEETAEQ